MLSNVKILRYVLKGQSLNYLILKESLDNRIFVPAKLGKDLARGRSWVPFFAFYSLDFALLLWELFLGKPLQFSSYLSSSLLLWCLDRPFSHFVPVSTHNENEVEAWVDSFIQIKVICQSQASSWCLCSQECGKGILSILFLKSSLVFVKLLQIFPIFRQQG